MSEYGVQGTIPAHHVDNEEFKEYFERDLKMQLLDLIRDEIFDGRGRRVQITETREIDAYHMGGKDVVITYRAKVE